MVCANRSHYRRQGEGEGGVDPFACGKCGRTGSPRSGSGGEFLRRHAPAFRIGLSATMRNSG
jgi:hypothetical protein